MSRKRKEKPKKTQTKTPTVEEAKGGCGGSDPGYLGRYLSSFRKRMRQAILACGPQRQEDGDSHDRGDFPFLSGILQF